MIGVILIVYTTTTTVMNITGFHNGQPIVDAIPADHAITVTNEVEPTVRQFSLLDAWRGFLDGTRNNVIVD